MKIMAPAGDSERLTAALKAGADEVYMGIAGFGARHFAPNFSIDEYCTAIDLAHQYGVAINLTLNTIMSDEELNAIWPSIARLYEQGLDAVIVQDWGVARWLQCNFPDLELHASTQMSLAHAEELNWLADNGFKRAVLARELTLNELETIRKKTQLELEVFASGALCLACSGKCYLSSFIGGRSGNRGRCTQPCRQFYRIREKTLNYNTVQEGFFLSLKDQWQDEKEIRLLWNMGIDAIKIEGRMKAPEYVYEAVRYYRTILDLLESENTQYENRSKYVISTEGKVPSARPERLAQLFNRGYGHGYFKEVDPPIKNRFFSSNQGVEIGQIQEERVVLSKPVRNGDGIVYLDKQFRKISGQNISRILLQQKRGIRTIKVDSAKEGDIVLFGDLPPENAVYVYRNYDYTLNREIVNMIQQTTRYSPVNAKIHAVIGQPLQLTLTCRKTSVTLSSETILEASKKIPANEEALQKDLDRFGGSLFYLNRCSITMDSNVFVPKSELNRLRQEAVIQLGDRIVASYRRSSVSTPPPEYKAIPFVITNEKAGNPDEILSKLAVSVRTQVQYDICQKFGIQTIYAATVPVRFGDFWRNLPTKGYRPLAGSLVEALWFEKQGIPFTVDWPFNIGNMQSILFLMERFKQIQTLYISPELSERSCQNLAKRVKGWRDQFPHLAIPIYGFLPGMFTRVTLFEDSNVSLLNQDNREIDVYRNKDWYEFGERENMTGSTVYDGEQLNLIDAIPWLLKNDFSELRLDFTRENAAQVLAILKQATDPACGSYNIHSYGFSKGIF